MAKIMFSVLLACCLFGNSNVCFSQLFTPERARVVATYKSQIGVREKTGHNDGTDVEKYLKTVGLGKGFSWCAAYVKWCLQSSGVLDAKLINGMALSLHRSDRFVYFKKYYLDPLPGDVFTLYYASLHRIGHTGFFNGWANKKQGMYYSVEGNTSGGGSRDGDGVYLRIRSISSTYSLNRWVK